LGTWRTATHNVENISYTMLITAVVETGLYGYYTDDPAARRDPLTGVEAADLAAAINELLERATGTRQRSSPEESHSPLRTR